MVVGLNQDSQQFLMGKSSYHDKKIKLNMGSPSSNIKINQN